MTSRRHSFVPLALTLLLMGCAQGAWPHLGAVERPVSAVAPAAGGAAEESPAPAIAPAVDRARLAAFRTRFDDQRATLQGTLGVYEAMLDRHLGQAPDTPYFAEAWSGAQSALSRLSAEIDDLRALNDEVTAFAAPLIAIPDAGAELQEVGHLVAAVDGALGLWRQRLYGEQNRLAVLTPAAVGEPGPNAIDAQNRTAFAEIRFAKPAPAFEAKLKAAVRALKAQVPDVAFDIIARGPAAARAEEQAALRQVLRALKASGVGYDQTAIAVTPDGEAVAVAIYLKKTSL
ncbi:MAG: hypothetical protein H3C28_03945 [Sphingomonadales bacterium]|nr:hypothetical protein [Sphingomonadales bacterium]